MTQPFQTQHPEIDELFDRYRRAPQSTIFAPLADACRKAGMLEEALDICRKGLAANPTYASGYVVQGKCLYDAERPQEAETSFRKVLELDGSNLVALKFIGIILAERRDFGAARACFEHILALDPEDRDIRRRLGEVVGVSSVTDVTLSDAAFEEIPLQQEPVAEVLVTRSEPAVAAGDFEGEPISLGEPEGASDEIATMTLADIYAAQGYTEKAMRIYREVQRRQPDSDDLRRKIAALESRAERRAGAEPAAAAPSAPVAPAVKPAPEPRPEAPAPARPAPAARPASGNRIDETRSYEQFKRWLRSVSD